MATPAPIDLDQDATSYPCTNQTATGTRSIHAKLIVGAGRRAAPPPDKALAARERQKAFATSDLLTQLLRADGPCGYVAVGGTTALWSATVGGPTAPAALQAPCAALRAALADQVAAARRSASIAQALLSTVDRETKAYKTHHATALKRQSAAGDAPVTQLKATERSERASGAKVAKLIGTLGVTGQLTAEQDGTAIAAIATGLKAKGVSQATLQRLAPSALTAAPYDLLAHLG